MKRLSIVMASFLLSIIGEICFADNLPIINNSSDAGIARTLIANNTSTKHKNSETSMQFFVHPNLFNSTVDIDFVVPRAGAAVVGVYNVVGKEIDRLFDGELSSGAHTLHWSCPDCPSGSYFVRIQSGDYHAVKRMLLVR